MWAGPESCGTAQRLDQQLGGGVGAEQQRGGVVGPHVAHDALVGGQVHLMPGQGGGLHQQAEQGGVLWVQPRGRTVIFTIALYHLLEEALYAYFCSLIEWCIMLHLNRRCGHDT